jgi:hypothetical protein
MFITRSTRGSFLVLLHPAWGMLRYGRHSRRDVESDADTNIPLPAAWRRYGYSS